MPVAADETTGRFHLRVNPFCEPASLSMIQMTKGFEPQNAGIWGIFTA
jgi:hypothetical protein